MQERMIGNFKISAFLIVFILFFSCNKQNCLKNDEAKELIIKNINILIDSIESFDSSKIPISPVSIKDFKNYKTVKIEKMRIGIIDSVLVRTDDLELNNQMDYIKFNLQNKDLINFKSNYKINIVKVNNYDINVLFVSFSNFLIKDNNAEITVKKVIGISMIKEIYFFKKEKGIWLFSKKKLIGMG